MDASFWADAKIFFQHNFCRQRSIGSLSNNDGDGYENVTKEVISTNDSEFFWSWILKDCIEVQTKKKEVVVLCSRPQQNVKFFIFTS